MRTMEPGVEYNIELEDDETYFESQRLNKSLAIEYKGMKHPISNGKGDVLTVFEIDTNTIAVLGVNTALGYVGMEVFVNGELDDSIFFQYDWQLEDAGIDIDSHSDSEIADILMQYIV